MTTQLNGLKAKHYIISDDCVSNRSQEGAINYALNGLRAEFEALYKTWGGKGAKFHLALTIEKPEPKPEPVDESHVGKPIDPKDRVTNSGRAPELPDDAAAPADIDPKTGMHKDYWVLSEEERAKGFVRPVRKTYIHVGCKPKHPLRDLTDEEKERYGDMYAKFETYPEGDSAVTGRFWRQADLDKKACGTSTTMGLSIAETYARNPKFYGATYCCACKDHFRVGEHGEFEWEDGSKVGT